MNYNFLTNIESCYIDIPAILYYSHIPAAIIMIALGVLLLIKSKQNKIAARVLFFLSTVFLVWVLIDLEMWLTHNSIVMMFFWSFFSILYVLMYILALYFIFTSIDGKNISNKIKYIFGILLLPIIIGTPTKYNLVNYNLTNCQPFENTYFMGLQYAIGIIIIIWAFIFTYKKYTVSQIQNKNKILFFSVGTLLFLITFLWSEIIGSVTENFTITQYGLFGAPIFATFLVYSIVKFKAFNIKLIGAQALVWTLIIVIGSQFFFIRNNTNRILTAITLVISAVVGLIIIRSVKKEIAQKERIEKLATSLEISNEKLKGLDLMKSEFVSLATHQIRGPLAAIKGYISLMIEGDYGQVPQTFNEPLTTIFKSTDSLSRMVTDFLDVSRLDLGQMKYEYTNFDFRELVDEVIKELKPNIDAKGLELRVKVTNEPCNIKADRTKLKQVLNNLVDNSSKYTKQGWLEVSVEKIEGKVLFAVKDSGVGISKETLAVLFQRFSRAKKANDTNILGTGLGLYIAKKIVEENSGKVWAESEGEGKGAQFYVELKLVE
jgi:signal transduction histidine kinase